MFEIDLASAQGRRCTLAGRLVLPDPTASTIEIAYDGRVLHAFEHRGANPTTLRFRIETSLDLTSARLATLTCTQIRACGTMRDLGTPLVRRIDIGDPQSLAGTAPIAPSDAEIARNFESLGDNCEFGVAMAEHGFTRPSLFRFGGTSEFHAPQRLPPTLLAEAIASYFDGLAEGDDLDFRLYGPEWIATSARYRFMAHTGVTDASLSKAELRRQHNRRMRLAVRNFVELAANPRTVFVRKSNGHETEADLRRLLEALRGLGEARLLWVTTASDEEPAGMISLLGDGLVKARISRFAPYADAGNPDRQAWRQVVANSWLVMEQVMNTQAM